VNYSESASETKILVEDHANADQLYDRIQTELLFALRKFIEFGYCKGSLGLEMGELQPQATGRRFRTVGKKAKVERKEDYQARNNSKSPDELDSLTLLVHCVRKAAGLVPAMSPENTTAPDLWSATYEEI
jgi:hypothetical protein